MYAQFTIITPIAPIYITVYFVFNSSIRSYKGEKITFSNTVYKPTAFIDQTD